MGLNRSTFDMIFGISARSIHVFITREHMSADEVLKYFGLLRGSGGSMPRLMGSNPTGIPTDRFPDGILLTADRFHPIGLISDDFEHSQQFGICSDELEFLERAEEIGTFLWGVTYETSWELL